MQTVLLIDVSAVFHPEWHKDNFSAARATLERVRFASLTYPLISCCIDDPIPGRSWRSALYPEYKAHRPEKDPGLVNALASAVQMLRDDGFPVWGVDGCEADDVIASASFLLVTKHKMQVAIGCVDKDLAQCVGRCATSAARVSMVRLDSGETIDAAGVEKKWGVRPDQMGDWLAIVGDDSDNIPGVSRLGAKTAAKYLREYGDWAGIVRAAENLSTEMTDKIRTSILTSQSSFALSRRLVSLCYDLPIPVEEITKPRIAKKRTMQTGTQIDLFQSVEQPYAGSTHNQNGAPNVSNQNALPPDYQQQMHAAHAQMNGARHPGAAQPGQINPPAQPAAHGGPMIFPPGNRLPPPDGYGYIDAVSGHVVQIASLQPIQGPQGGWQPAAPSAPQAPPQPAAGFFAPPQVSPPVATQESLSTPYTGGSLVAPPQAASGAFTPPAMVAGTAASAPTEAPKAKRGRPAKAKGELVSDEEAIEALRMLRAYLAQ